MRKLNRPRLASVVTLTCLTSIAALAGCHSHHDRDVVVYDEDHRFEHHGYFDDRHDWHGGYYDDHHSFHRDPRDFHGYRDDHH